MTALLEAPAPQVIGFRADRVGWFLDDDATSEVPRCFGRVRCPGCGHQMDAAATPGAIERCYCPNYDSRRRQWCGTEIRVRVELSALSLLPHPAGCVCGDLFCRNWEAV